MTLKDVIAKVAGNARAFPNGLETSIDDVNRFVLAVSLEPETENFAQATSAVVAVAENVDCKTVDEIAKVCDAAEESLRKLRSACLEAVAALK